MTMKHCLTFSILALALLATTAAESNAQGLTPMQRNLLRNVLPGMPLNSQRNDETPVTNRRAITTELRHADHWGVRFAPIPPVLRDHVEAVHDGRGLLIAHIFPDSPADLAGLQEGQILLGTRKRVLYKELDLPVLDQPMAIVILDHGVMKRVLVTPLERNDALPKPPISQYFPGHSLQSRLTTAVPQFPGTVAISGANGHFSVKADTPEGKVHLKGTRREINKQLDAVPGRTRTMIRHQLDLAN